MLCDFLNDTFPETHQNISHNPFHTPTALNTIKFRCSFFLFYFNYTTKYIQTTNKSFSPLIAQRNATRRAIREAHVSEPRYATRGEKSIYRLSSFLICHQTISCVCFSPGITLDLQKKAILINYVNRLRFGFAAYHTIIKIYQKHQEVIHHYTCRTYINWILQLHSSHLYALSLSGYVSLMKFHCVCLCGIGDAYA